MVGEEGEPVDVRLLLETVQLHASVVVHVEVALLGHGKQHLIVQKSEKRWRKKRGEEERRYGRTTAPGG